MLSQGIRGRLFLYLWLTLGVTTTTANASYLLVFAAASTTDTLEEVFKKFTLRTGLKIRASYASSGALARQIEFGAPANLFLSATPLWVDWAKSKKLLSNNSDKEIFQNSLVLVTNNTQRHSTPAGSNIQKYLSQSNGRLAMGDPGHVPAGVYAKIALQSLGMWKFVVNRTARLPDVRATLRIIERGELKLGIVYHTDALMSKNVKILETFPQDTHPPISYILSRVREFDTAATKRLYEFLLSPAAKLVYRKDGFLTD